MRNRQTGFSLVELLLVVAIILILAGMTIPNFIRSKLAANEASIQQTLETLNNACFSYWTMYDGYPETLSALESAQLIDSALASGSASGYTLNYSKGADDAKRNVASYTVAAVPTSPGITGEHSFFTNQTGAVQENVSAMSKASDAAVQ